jgi:hypothetical protein
MRVFIIFAILLAATPVYAQSMGTTSGAMAVINSSDPANTTNRVISAPTVAAPGLTAAGIETCLGSASGGLSAMGGGVTFGTTTVDEGCTIRLLARQLYAFGFQKAALALMCEDQHVVVAMYAAGSPCPRPLFAAATEPAPRAADNEPRPLSFFAAILEPSPASAAPERRVREARADSLRPGFGTGQLKFRQIKRRSTV